MVLVLVHAGGWSQVSAYCYDLLNVMRSCNFAKIGDTTGGLTVMFIRVRNPFIPPWRILIDISTLDHTTLDHQIFLVRGISATTLRRLKQTRFLLEQQIMLRPRDHQTFPSQLNICSGVFVQSVLLLTSKSLHHWHYLT